MPGAILQVSIWILSSGIARSYRLKLFLNRLVVTRGLTLFLVKTLWIVSREREQSYSLFSSFWIRLVPNLRFLNSRIHCSCWAVTFLLGKTPGRWLRLLRPSSPNFRYRRSHFSRVGLETPHLRQTSSASWVSSYSLTHRNRVFTSDCI